MADDPSALAARHVGRLRIRARAQRDVYPATVLIADALNTASLPGADRERLVVIRRLALGHVSLRRSAASVALRLEQAARQAATEAVGFESVRAGEANAVVFTDRAQALSALARTLASGARADQWFWTRVVPGWDPMAPRGDQWVHLMNAAHGGADAPALAAAVLEESLRAGSAAALLGAIAAGDATRWLRLEHWAHSAPAQGATPWQPTSVRAGRVVRQWSTVWGRSDARTTWLATLLTCIERPASIGDSHLPARVAGALARMDVPMREPSAPEWTQSITGEGTAGGGHPSRSAWDAELDRPLTTDRPHDALRTGADVEARRAIDEVAARSQPEWQADLACDRLSPGIDVRPEPAFEGEEGFFSHFAGIYFVVPILERLHFAAFLTAYPELADDRFATRLLWFIADRAGLPATDPLARAFEAQCSAPAEARSLAAWELPAPAREMLAVPLPRTSLSSPEVAWLTALRRWCRRRAGIGLTTLIRRPGRLHLSRTHIEASFPLSALDVRVRRSALDVDPGWVPWLGRVVQFTYGGHDDH